MTLKVLFHGIREKQIKGKQTTASTQRSWSGVKNSFIYRKQWLQEMISVKTVPTTIKLC